MDDIKVCEKQRKGEGKMNKRRILTPDEVRYINENAGKLTLREMRKHLHIGHHTISMILRMKGYARRRLTEEEIEWFKQNYATTPTQQILEHLHIGLTKMHDLARKYKLKKNKTWRLTEEQLQWLKENFADMSNAEICQHLGIKAWKLTRAASENGLKKSEEYIKQTLRPAISESRKQWWDKLKYTQPAEYRRMIEKATENLTGEYRFNKERNLWKIITPERKEELVKKSVSRLAEIRRNERMRVKAGLAQKTKLCLGKTKAEKSRHKAGHRLEKKYGYEQEDNVFYYSDTQKRCDEEYHVKKYGFIFRPLSDRGIEKKAEKEVVVPDWKDRQGGWNITN